MYKILPENFHIKKCNQKPFCFLEGPVWDKRRNCLYFSDPLAQTILEMSESRGFRIIQEQSGYVNGMCLNTKGNLVVCKMETGSLEEVSLETGKTIRTISAGFSGRPFNATNDVIADKNGGYYVTDPFFTFGTNAQAEELTYYVSPDGKTKPVANDSKKPNGLAFSPDEKWLYIDDTMSTNVWKYKVNSDGSLSDKAIACHLAVPSNGDELPEIQQHGEADGIKVDSAGNIYVTTYSGIQVFDKAGNVMGIIPMPEGETAANCAFGGDDLCTLYITARTSLYSVKVLIPGI